MSAAPLATSVPAMPIATPIWAWTRDGAWVERLESQVWLRRKRRWLEEQDSVEIYEKQIIIINKTKHTKIQNRYKKN